MKNEYRVEGQEVWIRLKISGQERYVETVVDLNEAPILMAINNTWYAQFAKRSTTKMYAIGKIYEPAEKKARTVMLHQVIAGEPRLLNDRAAAEIHHVDNDGLNNRRGNLDWLTHEGNMRAHIPDPHYWAEYDLKARRVHVFKRLVGIGNEVGAEFGVGRGGMHRIRSGRTRRGLAMEAYWKRVHSELPELFKAGDGRYSWIIVREFTALKGECGVGKKPAVVPRIRSGRLVSSGVA